MPVKYLSPEWIDAYNAAVAADDAVRKALKGKSAVIQMVVAEAPEGEIHYWLRIGDGTASVGLGGAGDAAGQKRHRKAGDEPTGRHRHQAQPEQQISNGGARQDGMGHGIAHQAHASQHQENADRRGPDRERQHTNQGAAHELEFDKWRDQEITR